MTETAQKCWLGAKDLVLAAMDRFGDNLELLRSAARVLTAVWSGSEHAKETVRAWQRFRSS